MNDFRRITSSTASVTIQFHITLSIIQLLENVTSFHNSNPLPDKFKIKSQNIMFLSVNIVQTVHVLAALRQCSTAYVCLYYLLSSSASTLLYF